MNANRLKYILIILFPREFGNLELSPSQKPVTENFVQLSKYSRGYFFFFFLGRIDIFLMSEVRRSHKLPLGPV